MKAVPVLIGVIILIALSAWIHRALNMATPDKCGAYPEPVLTGNYEVQLLFGSSSQYPGVSFEGEMGWYKACADFTSRVNFSTCECTIEKSNDR